MSFQAAGVVWSLKCEWAPSPVFSTGWEGCLRGVCQGRHLPDLGKTWGVPDNVPGVAEEGLGAAQMGEMPISEPGGVARGCRQGGVPVAEGPQRQQDNS